MPNNLVTLIARLESYSQDALTQAKSSIDQPAYWRGVRFVSSWRYSKTANTKLMLIQQRTMTSASRCPNLSLSDWTS